MKLLGLILMMELFCAPCAFTQDSARDQLKKAIEKVKKQESYRVKYKAIIKAPHSDPMVIQGVSVWVSPGVLYVDYRASGGDYKRIIRVGEQVWIYHELVDDWITAGLMGNEGAGRGVQNPDEVLSVIQNHLAAVKAEAKEKVGKRDTSRFAVKMTGPEIGKMMKEHTASGSFDWKKSKATARIWVDERDGLIYKFTSTAELKSNERNIQGLVRYTAEVEVLDYNKTKSIIFQVRDPKTGKMGPLAIPDNIKKAIAKMMASGSKR